MRDDMQRFYTFLNDRVFPRVVAYATHPLVILLTIFLLVPLIVFASITSLALILGNYTNVVSAAVSSIVLATSLKQHVENTQMHKQHSQDIAALHADHRALHTKIDAMESPAPASRNTSKKGKR
jgi:outer membrane murein-binding lipoprotein Lpp